MPLSSVVPGRIEARRRAIINENWVEVKKITPGRGKVRSELHTDTSNRRSMPTGNERNNNPVVQTYETTNRSRTFTAPHEFHPARKYEQWVSP